MKAGLVALLFIFIIMVITPLGIAQPTVESITYSPEEPAPLSSMAFTAHISGNTVSVVNLTVEECSAVLGTCFKFHTVTMEETSAGVYHAMVNLTAEEATYITYSLDISYDDTVQSYEEDSWKVNLTSDSNQNGDNNGTNNTPGFEFIPVIVAIFAVLVWYKKRVNL